MSNLISLGTKNRDIQIAVFTFSFAFLIGLSLDSMMGAFIFFFFLTFAATLFVPGSFLIQKFAISCTIFIGLSPIYLVFRGLITRTPLTSFDLQIYGALFIFTLAIIHNLPNSKNQERKLRLPTIPAVASALGGLAVALFVQFLLTTKSIGHAVAWIASGDSKNHAVNGVSLLELGFLDPRTFLTQPSSSPAFLSLFLSELNVDSFQLKINLELLMHTYALVWILLIGILGVTFSALLDVVWGSLKETKHKSAPNFLLIVASILATFSFAIGPALYDGFFTAIFGITTVALMISWYLEIINKVNFDLNYLFFGLLIFVSSVFAWMFVLPFTSILLLAGLTNQLLKTNLVKVKVFSGIFFLIIFIVLGVHFSEVGQEFILKSKTALNTTGAVNGSPPKVFYVLVGTLVIIGLILKGSNKRFGKSLLSLAYIQLIALILFKSFSNLSLFSWNYYLLKYQWIVFVPIFALIFVISASKIYSSISLTSTNRVFAIFLAVFVAFGISELSVVSNRAWQKIWSGWENPRSEAIDRMFNFAVDLKSPTLFFHHGYGGDAMLVNFWMTAFTDPIEPIKGWNYSIDTTGDAKQMCEVKYYYPTLRLITSDIKLEKDLRIACPEERFTIVLDSPLY